MNDVANLYAPSKHLNPKVEFRSILVVAFQTSAVTQMIYESSFELLGELGFSWRMVSECQFTLEDLEGLSLLILYRCIQGSTLSLVRLARKKKIKIIYELDDDLLEPPADEAWGQHYLKSNLPQVIQCFLAEVDQVKAGSRELADRLTRKGYYTVYFAYAVKQPARELKPVNDASPMLGYFGTAHHEADINAIFPALSAIQSAHPEVGFDFIGCAPTEWKSLHNACFTPQIDDYFRFLRILSQRCWTIGLAPLRSNHFNEAKSDSKFRDLSAAGIVGVYSDLPPYRDSVQHGVNGWLCGSSISAWVSTIQSALRDQQRDAKLQKAYRQISLTNHRRTVTNHWLKLFQNLKELQ